MAAVTAAINNVVPLVKRYCSEAALEQHPYKGVLLEEIKESRILLDRRCDTCNRSGLPLREKARPVRGPASGVQMALALGLGGRVAIVRWWVSAGGVELMMLLLWNAAVRQQSPLSTSSMASMVVIMLSWLLVIALFTALSAAGCPAVLPPGEYDIELDLVQAREVRSVHLYVPDTVSSSVPAPVLFLQHGGGGDWESIRNMAHIEPYARKYGMIVAYARGLQSIILNFRTFNSGECCGRAKAKDIDELAYFDAVMASLEQNTCIDRSRVYVSGFSNGGMNSWRIMCGRSERVAAVAPVSGPLGNGFVRACGTSDTHRCALDPYQGECFDTSYNDGTTVCASPFTSPTQLHYRCDNIVRALLFACTRPAHRIAMHNCVPKVLPSFHL